ncbi:hypothetical protein MNBD_GAMMA08-589 [hydrothermal vent metagenome]|uniref:Uncharacterized protein n=1 Tax=hydrothermal vent metagenome TaxID=652676 RepID=A0A3B0WSP9_9ZZZZ
MSKMLNQNTAYYRQVKLLVAVLPAVQWKILNIKKMSVKKHKQVMEKLEVVLSEKYFSS